MFGAPLVKMEPASHHAAGPHAAAAHGWPHPMQHFAAANAAAAAAGLAMSATGAAVSAAAAVHPSHHQPQQLTHEQAESLG